MAFDLKLALFKPLIKLAMERSGHGAALGFDLRVVERGEVSMTFPYNEAVIGNPVTGVVHGGVHCQSAGYLLWLRGDHFNAAPYGDTHYGSAA